MPLPGETAEINMDYIDLIVTNARDAIVAGQVSRASTKEHEADDTNDEPLTAPLTREEIIEAQAEDEYCQ